MASNSRRKEYPHEKREKRVVGGVAAVNLPAPDPEPELAKAMREYLSGRNLDYDSAVRLGGWYPATFHGPRIIIPCVRTDGGIWWQARTIADHPKRWHGCYGYRGDAVAYIPAEYEKPTVVCEGPMDALAAAGCGYGAIAILGADPPEIVYEHVAKLVAKSYRKNTAIILPDMDRLALWQKTQQSLSRFGVNGEIRCIPGGHKDLAECEPALRQEFLDGTD